MPRAGRILALVFALAATTHSQDSLRRSKPERRVPADFEKQGAILISGSVMAADLPDLFARLIEEIQEELKILVMVHDEEEQENALEVLENHGLGTTNVRFLRLEHDTLWTRDFGPVPVVTRDNSLVFLDAAYNFTDRAEDEKAPSRLAEVLKLPAEEIPVHLEGGNLLTNGQGLFLTTARTIDINRQNDVGEETVRGHLATKYGARQILVLEPLIGEPTGHVDMFATFVSADTVVVGRIDPNEDEENAAILDRNAEKLAAMRAGRGKLRVVRVPMPPREDGRWRTYTNLVFANCVVLVPIYPEIDEDGRRRALDTFAELLPGRRIVGIDADALSALDGSLRCVTAPLGPPELLPDLDE